MSRRPLPARPGRLALVVRAVSRPALVGLAVGALAAAVVPAAASSATVAGMSDVSKDGRTLVHTDVSGNAVTDDDGLKNAIGETVFLRLGHSVDAFADQLRSTTTLSLPRTTAVYGQKPTATVMVSGGAGVAASGPVTVKDGGAVVGRGTVQDGTALVTLSDLRVGSGRLVAEYAGDARTTAGTSAPFALTVAKGTTSTSLSVAASSARTGSKVTARVRVDGTGFTPTGRVQIKEGSRVVKTVTVSGSTRSVKIRLSRSGQRTLRAYFVGSDVAAPSASVPDRVTVRGREG